MANCTRRNRSLGWVVGLLACFAPSAAQAALSFNVGGTWPNDAHRTAAVNAMQAVVNRYNAYGNFGNYNIYVYYNAGIPTAQASYQGSIGFGGTYPGERVAMHEAAHYLGLPSGSWNSLMSGGSWDGVHGNAIVDQFDGIEASLNGDSAHFWPYGLNYDSEGSEINKQRAVAVVYAMRADLGIGSATHPSTATTVTMTASNPLGESGFNYKAQWSDGYFAHAGADYLTGDFAIRTPVSGNSFKFAGDSLTINNTTGVNGGLYYKGTGSTGVTTIDDLIVNGGYLQHQNNIGDIFKLDGRMTVASGGANFRAKQGNIEVLADVVGSGSITIHPSDFISENNRYVRFKSGANTFTGNLINNSRFELSSGANFKFNIGASGVNNAISGASSQATLLNGMFQFDLTGASSTPGDSWSLVSAANTTYGSSFSVAGFNLRSGLWRNDSYAFSPATGMLSVLPPPPEWNVNGGGLWNVPSNWTSGVPAANDDAVLGNVLTAPNAPATVTLNVPATLNSLEIDNANRYVIAGTSPLTMTGEAKLIVPQGSHQIDAPIAGTAGLNFSGGGTVALNAANAYSGATNISAGTLALAGGGSIAGSAVINVSAGTTFDVSNTSSTFATVSGQTLATSPGANVMGNVSSGAGSTLKGNGRFMGNVVAQAGSVVQVGGDTNLLEPQRLIDNFSGNLSAYTSTRLLDNNGGASNAYAWQIASGTLQVRTTTYDGIEQSALTRGDVTLDVGEEIKADYLHNATSAQDIGLYVGAATPTANVRQDFVNIYMRNDGVLYARGFNGTSEVGLVSGGAVSPSSLFIARTGTNNFEVGYYVGATRTVVTTRTMTNSNIGAVVGFYSDVRAAGTRGSLDNLWHLDPDRVLGDVLTVDNNFTLDTGATLRLEVFESGINDKLAVGGVASFAGTLQVVLGVGAPALAIGSTFDLLDFGSAVGSFSQLVLPTLAAGRSWDRTRLYTEGVLSVAAGLPGDYGGDGVVDAADYSVWRDNLGSATTLHNDTSAGSVTQADYDVWKANFGNTISASIAASSAVPEAQSLTLVVIAIVFLARLPRLTSGAHASALA